MLFKNIYDDGNSVAQVEWPKTCSTVDKVAKDHTLEKRPFFTGECDDKKGHGASQKSLPKDILRQFLVQRAVLKILYL